MKFRAVSVLLILTCVACSSSDGSSGPALAEVGTPSDTLGFDGCGDCDGSSFDGFDGESDGARSDSAPDESFSFVVVGCNRVENADISTKSPSTANLEQLTRTFKDVAALEVPPKFFFFAGDMVYGYTDAIALESELKAWLEVYAASPLPALGVQLVPLQGNHESQAKSGKTKLAYPAAETTWVSVMGAYIRGSNGPKAGGADGLATDQSKLTYSFDHGGSHFVILNTDPVGMDWQVPARWVADDVAAAHAAGAKHIFAIGHKPAYPSPLSGEGGLSQFPVVRDAFWTALENNHSEAMIAAHNHLWFRTQPKKTWQIVAGNGGSLLESGVTGKDAYYGFTLVRVDKGGSVTATSYGRDVPSTGYMGAAAAYPTTIRETVDITWK